jgi:hypothetical protein
MQHYLKMFNFFKKFPLNLSAYMAIIMH